MNAGDLDRLIRIEQKAEDNTFDGAGSEPWQLFAQAWAQVQDMLPSRGERLADGLNIATRPARVRIRYIEGVKASMRIVMGDRIMQIVSAPAELGRREGLELMVEDYSTSGNG